MLYRGSRRLYYLLAIFLTNMTWGLYFVSTRHYLSVELGGGAGIILFIAGLEWLYMLFAIFAGRLSRILGARQLIFLGFLGAVPPIIAIYVKDPYLLSIILSSSNLPWALSWPIIVSAIMGYGGDKPGIAYGFFTVGSSIGYSIGSICSGILRSIGGIPLVLISISIFYILSYSIYFKLYQSREYNAERGSVYGNELGISENIYPLIYVLASYSLIVLSRELLYSIAPYRIDAEIARVFPGINDSSRYVLFAIFFGGLTSILSAPARILAGILSDRYNPIYLLMVIGMGYLSIYWLFAMGEGIFVLLAWQIPLYPFLDVSINTYIARYYHGEARIFGLGAVLFSSSIGGLLQLLIFITSNPDIRSIGYAISISIAISLALLMHTLTHKR
ncbi:MAG: MFS transporter [Sulfolobales archaeon]